MIRMFLLAAGFLSVTIALLVSQLGEDDSTTQSDVTRANTSAFNFEEANREAANARTREPDQKTGFLGSRSAGQSSATRNTSDASLSQIDLMTRNILQELRQPVTGDRLRQVATSTGGESDEMRSLTDGVLAGLGTSDSTDTISDSDSPQSLNALIIQAMREGQSDAYVDALLNEAVDKGEVVAPAALVTPSGEVDTATLLDSLVQQSFSAQAAPTQAAPVVVAPVLPKPAPVAVAAAEEGDLFYTVQPGDSLAGIALRHYGTTTAHEMIFLANRDLLPSPSAVRPGMKLRIPEL